MRQRQLARVFLNFPVWKYRQHYGSAFPLPPLIQGCLEGLRFHQGNFGGRATLIGGRGGKICCGKWFLRSKFSFIPKCLNSFVRDCGFFFQVGIGALLGLLVIINFLRSPEVCILDAVFTVSPNKQYRGILLPTTPATHGPTGKRKKNNKGHLISLSHQLKTQVTLGS